MKGRKLNAKLPFPCSAFTFMIFIIFMIKLPNYVQISIKVKEIKKNPVNAHRLSKYFLVGGSQVPLNHCMIHWMTNGCWPLIQQQNIYSEMFYSVCIARYVLSVVGQVSALNTTQWEKHVFELHPLQDFGQCHKVAKWFIPFSRHIQQLRPILRNPWRH